ncbi:DNA double-strand break repair nuclease NurA [uncultured Thermanaerothrix sp.]|uniref:DNA double-strand break repair nuclease NurA n=1 Tax=uncultured Thermanaerothrix sp. TaxID=1195149 RepID=UPI002619CB9A|nr:DNA double-strand break repair nuclease NurA [uncultured Thermanaerothrix sp.]
MMESAERPFGELPAALVDEILRRTEDLSQKLLADFEQIRARRQEWRTGLEQAGLLRRDAELPYMPIPTTCGVDGAYAVERLLASDLVAAAAVAVEGLTPPSETRHWPEPRHLVWVETEVHEAETSTILRALMIGMELMLASRAPHEVVFLDGSLTTPLIYFNQALNKSRDTAHLMTTQQFLGQMVSFLEVYQEILASARSDRCWLAIPKYTARREIGQKMGWPDNHDDRGLLSFLLEPGEYTCPRSLQPPTEPWHLNLNPLEPAIRETTHQTAEKIISLLGEIQVVYYRPYPWLPALRVEMSRAVAENQARLATALHGIRYQCGAPAVMEPYPLYMADRMVKHLSRAIPTFRQVTSQYIAETYRGNVGEVFLGLHGYRTESGG